MNISGRTTFVYAHTERQTNNIGNKHKPYTNNIYIGYRGAIMIVTLQNKPENLFRIVQPALTKSSNL